MELIKLRRRAALAQKGHDLLREKMDALIMELFEILGKIQEHRSKAVEQLMNAHRALSKCLAVMGTVETIGVVRESKRESQLGISPRFIMGVQVPTVEATTERGVLDRGYSLHTTTTALDSAAKEFELALKSLSELAELEAAAYALASELEKTKRRVNALEYIIIPKIKRSLKFIVMRLDEMERENFTRLKRIKAILEERR
jgi:V/A-type H+-transporting ATPase subunit D